MLTGEIKDAAGVTHMVSYTTRDQNEQMIALVSPSLLRIVAERSSLLIKPGSEVTVLLQIKRDRNITSPVRLELALPSHMRDVSAEPLTVLPDVARVEFCLRFGASSGPFNMPLMIRATAEKDGEIVVAEALIDAVTTSD